MKTYQSELKKHLIDLGYNQTRLRKEFGYNGAIVPLAKELLPGVIKAGIVNKNGVPTTTVQPMVEALCAIRNKRTHATPFNRKPRRRVKRTVIAPPRLPSPTSILVFIDQLPDRVRYTLEQVEIVRAELIAIQGQLAHLGLTTRSET